MQRYAFDKSARKWVKVDETQKKRVTRRKKVTAENKAAETENK